MKSQQESVAVPVNVSDQELSPSLVTVGTASDQPPPVTLHPNRDTNFNANTASNREADRKII